MTDQTYSKTELMICVAARLFEDGTTAFIGTGIPMLAAMLATKTIAPNLVPVFEFGGLGAILRSCREQWERHARSIEGWWQPGSVS